MTTNKLDDDAKSIVPYPFIRKKVTLWDEEGGYTIMSWVPGTRPASEYAIDSEADAMGSMVLNIVSVHKPGKYPERVFYTRAWIDPDGKRFGKPKLRMTTTRTFRAMLHGYRHDYSIKQTIAEANP